MRLELNEDESVRFQIFSKYLNRVNNVPLPATFTRIERFSNTKPTNIIVHDTGCLNHSDSVLNLDGPNTGMGALKMNDISKDGFKDVNFHFIVDRLGADYEIISGRPISSMCQHSDIDSSFNLSIHVIILSDLNVDIPKMRLYQILSYRCISPLMRMLKIGSDPNGVIKFHSEVTTDKKIKCPGDFLSRELLVDQARRFL